MRLRKLSVVLTVVMTVIFLVMVHNLDFANEDNITSTVYQTKSSKCEVIHVGVVCTNRDVNVYKFYTLLKSLYFFRTSPLHFHIIADNITEKTVKTLFDTWVVPHVSVNLYNINGSISSLQWTSEKHHSGLLKLMFPEIVPVELTNKIIVINPELIFASNIYELWNVFDNFRKNQVIGLAKRFAVVNGNSDGFNTDLILYHLGHISTKNWNKILIKTANKYINLKDLKLSDQDSINEVVNKDLDSVYQLPCHWNLHVNNAAKSVEDCFNGQHQFKFVHWNSSKHINPLGVSDRSKAIHTTFAAYDGNMLRWQLGGCTQRVNKIIKKRPVPKACTSFPEAQLYNRTTLLFFREFRYTPTANDVTFVTQLSSDKLPVLNEIGRRWQGPMSLSFYLTDTELQKCINYIENSAVLQNRSNIAYHAIFKEGNNHPINALRNIALSQVTTPYVFLNDIDLVPMQGIYMNLKNYISEMGNMDKKALVVPAFETTMLKTEIPNTKQELLEMMDNNKILIVQYRFNPRGHGPTNYKKWETADKPYQVKWKFRYEPYVVVQRNVTKYDERFFAYGWDKISHIMELEAQGYEFIVLPNAFVVHKAHPGSSDKRQFTVSAKYHACLKSLKKESAAELKTKYGRSLNI